MYFSAMELLILWVASMQILENTKDGNSNQEKIKTVRLNKLEIM